MAFVKVSSISWRSMESSGRLSEEPSGSSAPLFCSRSSNMASKERTLHMEEFAKSS